MTQTFLSLFDRYFTSFSRSNEDDLKEQLSRVEKRLSNVYTAVHESSIISHTNVRGIISYANDNFCRISGYSKDELLGRPHSIVNSGYHSKEFWAHVWTQISQGQVWRGEVCNRSKSGKIYWVDTFIYPCFNEKGKLTEFFSIRNDITERKLQEQGLSKSESLLRSIFNSTTDLFFLLSPDLNLMALNREAEIVLHGDSEIEQAMLRLISLQEGFKERFGRALKGETIEVEREVLMLDGNKNWYSIRYQPAYNETRHIIGVSLNLTNIQTRKLQELALKKQNEALSNIAWMQSHEIRRPVTSIMGLMRILEADSTQINNPELLAHLKKMAYELDAKTRQIVNITTENEIDLK